MPELVPAADGLGAFGYGCTPGNRETRDPAPHASAPPPVAARQAAGPSLTSPPVGVYPPVDRLRTYTHEPVVRPQDTQPAADQQRRPAASQPCGHLRPQAPIRQAMRLARLHPAPLGLALRGSGDVITPGPRSRLQAFWPVWPVRIVLVGREPRVALDLPADGGRAAPEHRSDRPYAGAVADLDLDDLSLFFRQVRIHYSHRCNIPPDWFSGQLPIYRVLHFQLDNGETFLTVKSRIRHAEESNNNWA